MYKQDTCGFIVKQGNQKAFTPVFLIEHSSDGMGTDPVLFGNPFNRHQDDHVYADRVFGQSIEPSSDIDLNFIAMMTGQVGGTGAGRPCGDLRVEVYGPTCNNTLQLMARGVLIEGQCGSGYKPATSASGRWHWYGAYMDNSIRLLADTRYYIVLSSPDSGIDCNSVNCCSQCVLPPSQSSFTDEWNRWVFATDYSEILDDAPMFYEQGEAVFPNSAEQVPTFMKQRSYSISATLKTSGDLPFGCTFPTLDNIVKLNGGLADAGFIFADTATTRPIIIIDENEIDIESCDNGRVAVAGDEVTNHLAGRNIGAAEAAPRAGLLEGPYMELNGLGIAGVQKYWEGGSNLQFGSCTQKNMDVTLTRTINCTSTASDELAFLGTFPSPPSPAVGERHRYTFKLGYESPGGTVYVDDIIPYEIRRVAEICDECCSSCP